MLLPAGAEGPALPPPLMGAQALRRLATSSIAKPSQRARGFQQGSGGGTRKPPGAAARDRFPAVLNSVLYGLRKD